MTQAVRKKPLIQAIRSEFPNVQFNLARGPLSLFPGAHEGSYEHIPILNLIFSTFSEFLGDEHRPRNCNLCPSSKRTHGVFQSQYVSFLGCSSYLPTTTTFLSMSSQYFQARFLIPKLRCRSYSDFSQMSFYVLTHLCILK